MKRLLTLFRDLVWTARHADGVRSWLRLSCDVVRARLMRLFPTRRQNLLRTANLRGGVQLHYRLNRADLWTIHEVWVEQEYRVSQLCKPRVVVDLGANIGLTSLWFANLFDAVVIAVEPSEANAAVARKNLERFGSKATVVQAAVGAAVGTGTFLPGPASTCGRMDFHNTLSNSEQISERAVEVPIIDMASVLRLIPSDSSIDLLKIDIEGGEEELLRGDVSWLDRVNAILIEFHPDLIDYHAALATLVRAGFQRSTAVTAKGVEFFERTCRTAPAAHGEVEHESDGTIPAGR
jgi:FkbM family methyltransferase